jgi:hypothetical protein
MKFLYFDHPVNYSALLGTLGRRKLVEPVDFVAAQTAVKITGLPLSGWFFCVSADGRELRS